MKNTKLIFLVVGFRGLICYANKKTRIFDGKIRVLCYVYYIIKNVFYLHLLYLRRVIVKYLRVGLTIGSS